MRTGINKWRSRAVGSALVTCTCTHTLVHKMTHVLLQMGGLRGASPSLGETKFLLKVVFAVLFSFAHLLHGCCEGDRKHSGQDEQVITPYTTRRESTITTVTINFVGLHFVGNIMIADATAIPMCPIVHDRLDVAPKRHVRKVLLRDTPPTSYRKVS